MSRWTGPPRWLACAFATAILAVGVAGCSHKPDIKVVVIGIDGMEWALVDPLLEEGKLPNIAALIEGGVRADLRSLEPREKSPTIWTTIATGKGPIKHGIADFQEETGEQPLYNSLGWRARPIWKILGEKGYTVAVVNWLMSWPALPVNGHYVSDRIAYAPEDGYDPVPELTYPPELADEIAPLRQPYSATDDDEIAYYMNGDLWRGGEGGTRWGGVETLKTIWAFDQTVLNTTTYLLDTKGQPDFLAVYFQGLDQCCHRFWGQMQPWTVDLAMSEEFIEAFKPTIVRYHERIDAIVGEIVSRVDENTVVIICSDHGFEGPKRTKDGLKLGIWMHGPVGVLIGHGPGVGKGSFEGDASVLDVTPTILTLLGEPVGRDMDGFVLTEFFEDGYLDRTPVSYVDTYETGEEWTGGVEPLTSPVDEEIKEQLRSLGYIE